MVPRLVVKVKRTVRRLARRGQRTGPEAAQNRASWQAMLSRIDAEALAAERRLADAERALNRLTLS